MAGPCAPCPEPSARAGVTPRARTAAAAAAIARDFCMVVAPALGRWSQRASGRPAPARPTPGERPAKARRRSGFVVAEAGTTTRSRANPGDVHVAQFPLQLADLVTQPRRDLELQLARGVQH